MSTSGNRHGHQIAHAHSSNDPIAQNTSADPGEALHNHISTLNNIFNTQRLNPEQIEAYLHDLWTYVIENAIVIPANNGPAQKSLVAELVNTRYRSSLSLDAMTADGRLWKDLPFLVKDISKVYLDNWMGLSKKEKLNLDAFTARLVAADEKAYALELCGLLVFRETLEKRRSQTTVAELLPAAVAWFEHAGGALVEFLPDGPYGYHPRGTEGRLSAVGELALEAHQAPGFNPRRWNFWKQRLGQLSSMGDEETREQARKGIDCMDNAARIIHGYR